MLTPKSNDNANTYEEARKQRLEENKKRFEDLGIASVSKGLTELTNSEKKSQQGQLPKPRSKTAFAVEPRRSTRVRNPVQTYRYDVDMELPFSRKKSRSKSSSWASYLARPIEEVKLASYEERTYAFKAAEELQKNLKSDNPCFVKSMVRSHVYSCFWLGLPLRFCKDHLPKKTVDMELENEDGKVYDAVYIGERSGLSGGWRAFALEHKLDDGDALVFELVEPCRFKIYIVRVSMLSSQECNTNMNDKENNTGAKKKPKRTMKSGDALAKNDGLVNSDEVKQDASLVSKGVEKDRGDSKTSETCRKTEPKCLPRRSTRKPTPKRAQQK
ncbi:Putative B3 domain-containing protein [Morus notabilis]|uniref:Putative B3 domain-containing protein n=1 Tax=Morus notabilis TaxID=981085 RepID=W9QW98_9ROSA|nr:putative B3 domain-containing protein At5g58280 [Morus notabilis]XP_024020034.1 putative B3 domain-containing protein At5g58280 [Morus notabilis]EXB56029.1 Putative B3 domain-containing protein [Morus notabilis]